MAKVFNQFDADGNGAIDESELKRALAALELEEVDVAAALQGFDANGDGLIQLSEWEQGLTPEIRSKIELKADSEGRIGFAAVP